MYYDWTFGLIIIAIIISAWAQIKVSSTYSKYSKVMAQNGMTASDVARLILDSNNLQDVPVERVAGNLTDHYDPRTRVLRLSDTVYNSSSVAAIGVAAHEVGHAIQDEHEYAPLKVRGALVPLVSFSSSASWVLIILGIFLSSLGMIQFGILLFSAVVIFQLVTLPVEFNASSRALVALEGGGFLNRDEVEQSRKVLSAAAMTYVAAALASILQLIRLLAIFGHRD
ncbi:MAG: zinc metallopeptidase [Clostridia bacterium]|nr:zinc metallopeptidase [Clostridia bacterium]MDD4798039.1 zinc metallopeptidase [Clostridia bacterium]